MKRHNRFLFEVCDYRCYIFPLAPAYCISERDVQFIVDKEQNVVEHVFYKFKAEGLEVDLGLDLEEELEEFSYLGPSIN